jgi:hypothetical protein
MHRTMPYQVRRYAAARNLIRGRLSISIKHQTGNQNEWALLGRLTLPGNGEDGRCADWQNLAEYGRSDDGQAGAMSFCASIHHTPAPVTSSSSLQTNSIIAATKHRIFDRTFSASGSGSAGKANPNAAQMANTTNIPATA